MSQVRRQRRRWRIAPPHPDAERLGRALGTAPLVGQILCNRGVSAPEDAQAFLDPKLTHLHDPSDLPDAPRAADRIAAAVRQGERIVIYGDYDVDGITAVAILHALLTLHGASVDSYIPHRTEEGYGVNEDAVRKIIAAGTQVLITVDCGISAAGPLALATAAGIDVIVTDHHTPPDPLPDVYAIVHPALPDRPYANPDLSGAGVAFKLAWATARAICGSERVDGPMRDFLLNATSLAALGTIADVVSLVGENRVLATYGLRGLPVSKHSGLRALIEASSLTGETLDAYHVGFVLAPRLNACGRMGHAQLAVELLTTAPPDRAREIAEYLNAQNAERQKVEREIAAAAEEMVVQQGLDDPAHRAIVLASEQWHGGVIGIVASRLVSRFHRPVVLIALGTDGLGHGSGRSIPDFHLCDALAACGEHLLGFGGHAMAGGLKIEPGRIDAFRAAFARHAAERIPEEHLTPVLDLDAETTLAALSYPVVQHLARLAPFGQGNRAPVLAIPHCEIAVPPKRMGRTGTTVGLHVKQGAVSMRAVGFGMGDLADDLRGVRHVDLAATPALNTFNGRTSIELKLEDVVWR